MNFRYEPKTTYVMSLDTKATVWLIAHYTLHHRWTNVKCLLELSLLHWFVLNIVTTLNESDVPHHQNILNALLYSWQRLIIVTSKEYSVSLIDSYGWCVYFYFLEKFLHGNLAFRGRIYYNMDPWSFDCSLLTSIPPNFQGNVNFF